MTDAVTRPPDIRLEDLVNPIFPDEVVSGLKAFASVGEALEFNLDALMAAASEGTGGLDEFGSKEYFCDAAEENGWRVTCKKIQSQSLNLALPLP